MPSRRLVMRFKKINKFGEFSCELFHGSLSLSLFLVGELVQEALRDKSKWQQGFDQETSHKWCTSSHVVTLNLCFFMFQTEIYWISWRNFIDDHLELKFWLTLWLLCEYSYDQRERAYEQAMQAIWDNTELKSHSSFGPEFILSRLWWRWSLLIKWMLILLFIHSLQLNYAFTSIIYMRPSSWSVSFSRLVLCKARFIAVLCKNSVLSPQKVEEKPGFRSQKAFHCQSLSEAHDLFEDATYYCTR